MPEGARDQQREQREAGEDQRRGCGRHALQAEVQQRDQEAELADAEQHHRGEIARGDAGARRIERDEGQQRQQRDGVAHAGDRCRPQLADDEARGDDGRTHLHTDRGRRDRASQGGIAERGTRDLVQHASAVVAALHVRRRSQVGVGSPFGECARLLIDAARGVQQAIGPQSDAAVAGIARKALALMHEPRAQAVAACPGLDE